MGNVRRDTIVVPEKDGDAAIRCAYPTLVEAKEYPGSGNPKFDITLMFDKKNPLHMKAINQLLADLEACRTEQWPDVSKRPRTPIVADQPHLGPKCPIKDGDVAINDKGIPISEANPEYIGHYIVKASCRQDSPPRIVDANNVGLLPAKCRAGFWYKIGINAYAYPQGSGGVTVGLNGVQLMREDEILSGAGADTADLFGNVGGDDPSLYSDGAKAAAPLTSAANPLGGLNTEGDDPLRQLGANAVDKKPGSLV